ncbi:MAG: RluA family pseudouridine synthase [Candidatus Cloacimonas sp.]|jgi:23S rRNA pseudouridine1911/1915/1917 synthase|nr:RluA family pseudouridine synthase [Candidatus Cloacimonas sp.]
MLKNQIKIVCGSNCDEGLVEELQKQDNCTKTLLPRLDKFLVELNIQELYSRSFIERLIDDDKILVNSIPVKKSYPLKPGDEIILNLPEPEPQDVYAQDIPLDVVYEDDHLAIINKAPGMIVHPGFGNPDGTLVNAIMHRFGSDLSSGREVNRPGIVHRLDRGTSGLIMIAKNDAAQAKLSEMFANRQVKKTYLAITSGVPDPANSSIETYISRSTRNPRMMVVSDAGRWSLTHYETLKTWHYFALLKVNLETGRMHQIRVHLAHVHYPVLGDLLYNTRRYVHSLLPQNMKRKATELLTTHLLRQALHSWKLEFVHPVSGKEIVAVAELPEDLNYTLAWLNSYFAIDTDSRDLNMFLNKGEL